MKDLTHKKEVGAVFSDESLKLNDYLRDDSELLIGSADSWYIGLYKPFKDLYFESELLNLNESSIKFEYWNGTSFLDLPNLVDDTNNFQRNGFIKWSFDDNSMITDSWKELSVDGDTLYWVKITETASKAPRSSEISISETGNAQTIANLSDENVLLYSVNQIIYIAAENSYHKITDVDTTPAAANITFSPALTLALPDNEPLYSPISVRGMNVVYSDDNQLKSEVRGINDYTAQDDSSFIAYHVSARDEIVQTLRNGGTQKKLDNSNKRINLTKWDVLDIGEITQAAKYLCLAKIFFDSSENTEDKAYQRYSDYQGMYGAAFKLFYMSLDKNDDGNTNTIETLASNNITISKV